MDTNWFTEEDLNTAQTDDEVVAMGLTMWANCIAGNGPIPEYFGWWMVKAGERLKISPLPENFSALADEILKTNSA